MTLDKWGRTLCKACGFKMHDPKYLMCLDCGQTYQIKKILSDKGGEAELKSDKDMEMYLETRDQALEFENRRGE